MRAALLTLALLLGAGAPEAGAQPPPGVPRTVRIFKLKSADAQKLSGIVTNIFGRQGVTAAADARTNSLVVTGDGETLEEVRKLVTKLDGPGK
jgi:type II secretory pathway component GspD/PulD (secretin)